MILCSYLIVLFLYFGKRKIHLTHDDFDKFMLKLASHHMSILLDVYIYMHESYVYVYQLVKLMTQNLPELLRVFWPEIQTSILKGKSFEEDHVIPLQLLFL